MDFSNLLNIIYEYLTVYGLRVVAAIAIFILGRWVAGIVANVIKRLMRKSKTDETLIKFVRSLIYIALLAFVIIASLNQLGIQTASFIAVLGAAGLAIGLALQGSLGNFAAGPRTRGTRGRLAAGGDQTHRPDRRVPGLPRWSRRCHQDVELAAPGRAAA